MKLTQVKDQHSLPHNVLSFRGRGEIFFFRFLCRQSKFQWSIIIFRGSGVTTFAFNRHQISQLATAHMNIIRSTSVDMKVTSFGTLTFSHWCSLPVYQSCFAQHFPLAAKRYRVYGGSGYVRTEMDLESNYGEDSRCSYRLILMERIRNQVQRAKELKRS